MDITRIHKVINVRKVKVNSFLIFCRQVMIPKTKPVIEKTDPAVVSADDDDDDTIESIIGTLHLVLCSTASVSVL